MAEDFYAILGVPKDASTQDIKASFRKLARECHPDTAGEDPVKLARFKQVREAYEVLSDPVQRARYDRRGEPRGNSPFLGSSWGRVSDRPPESGGRAPVPPQDLDLEDLLTGFSASDFGFGGRPGTRPGPRPQPRPAPGRDIPLTVDVPEDVASHGGIVTLTYRRLRRADDGALVPYEEIHDLRVPPGTTHNQELRVRGMGDAGASGGAYGELVCRVRLVQSAHKRGRMKMPRGAEEEEAPSQGSARTPAPPAAESLEPQVVKVDVRVTEAILGGRVQVETPGGTVRITVPSGTDSGTRLRLRGKGRPGADGMPQDLFVELRIVVPKRLDAESRRLIEQFGELNPEE